MRSRALAVGERMRAENGIANATAAIEAIVAAEPSIDICRQAIASDSNVGERYVTVVMGCVRKEQFPAWGLPSRPPAHR